jgi:hypothetical protein
LDPELDEYDEPLILIDPKALENGVETKEMKIDPLVILQQENEQLKKQLQEMKQLLEESITLKLDKVYERDFIVTNQITETTQSFNNIEKIESPKIIIVPGKPKKKCIKEQTKTILSLFDM